MYFKFISLVFFSIIMLVHIIRHSLCLPVQHNGGWEDYAISFGAILGYWVSEIFLGSDIIGCYVFIFYSWSLLTRSR